MLNQFLSPDTVLEGIRTTTQEHTASTTMSDQDPSVSPTALKKSPESEKFVYFDPNAYSWRNTGDWVNKAKPKSDEEANDLLMKVSLMESFLNDTFMNDWFYNTSLVITATFFAWFFARWGGGLAWLFIVLAFASTTYCVSIGRFRYNVRDDLARRQGFKNVETSVEHLEWLNTFLIKFWLIYEPVLSTTIVATTNQVLSGVTPGFIEGLSLNTFTLGTKSPRIDHVRSFPKTAEDVVVMDWKFSFVPDDTGDLTAKQIANKVNPKVVLGVRIGKGFVSKSLPVIVENMAFSGLMRVKLKLIQDFPHVQTVDISFLEPPKIDFVLKPIGGETLGLDINIVPGLTSFINDQINSNLSPMMYAPNAFQIDVQQMMQSVDNSAVGVLVVTIHNARGIEGSSSIGNTVDPYVKFSFNDDEEELARTEVKSDTKTPHWEETKFLMVKNLQDVLKMEVLDFNDFRKDKSIGTVSFELGSLEEEPRQTNLSGRISDENYKPRGELLFDVSWFPVLRGEKLEDGTIQPPPPSNTGIVTFTVNQCKDLSAKMSLVGQLSPYAQMILNGKPVHRTRRLKRTNDPVWDDSFELLITDRQKCTLGVSIFDDRDMANDPIIGSYNLKLDDLVAATSDDKNWFNLDTYGKVCLSANWKPIALTGVTGTSGITEPIGTIRLDITKAMDLLNLSTTRKIDPYVRVFINGFVRSRTYAFEDELNPVWNDVLYVAIQSERQTITLEAMDVEGFGKDRSLGKFTLQASDFIKKDDNGEYLSYEDQKLRQTKFQLGKKEPKGTLSYSVSFFPTLPIMSPEEIKQQKEVAEKEGKEDTKKIEELNDEPLKEAENKEISKKSEATEKPKGPKKLNLSLEELLEYSTGIIVYEISQADVSDDDTYVQVLFDNYNNPSFSTKVKKRKNTLGEHSDCIIRELEWSRIIIRVCEKKNPKDSEIISSVTIPTITFLKRAYDKSHTLELKSKNNRISQITIKALYFPVSMELRSFESINDMGTARFEIIDAKGLPAADSNGKSDPYAIIKIDGEKVFKTKTVKKSLNPTWDESCEASIYSRAFNKVEVVVYDWDMGPGDDDFLGSCLIDLSDIKIQHAQEMEMPLQGESRKSGSIRMRVFFQPHYVVRRQYTDDFGGAVGAIAANPVKGIATGLGKGVSGAGAGVSGVAHLGLKGASKLKGGVGSLLGKKKSSPGLTPPESHSDTVSISSKNSAVTTSMSSQARNRHAPSIMSTSSNSSDADTFPGQATIISAQGFAGSSHLQAKISILNSKEKELLKSRALKPKDDTVVWNETCNFKASTKSKIIFKIRDHKSLGSDYLYGEASLQLADLPDGEVTLPISSKGTIKVHVTYECLS
ncbi:tricalbin [Nadsonia fulvescens var. elongata DSM 6958]|uniref:Tricalbin n=1 Tax=Nadsonia fulvescens var. elongata DSM 6958 TaxID=857566 RepID=A0A1E3PKB2_9ASCO|nr:tricalbin [Nadsonia fulvescens var. elongata DSM 6958]